MSYAYTAGRFAAKLAMKIEVSATTDYPRMARTHDDAPEVVSTAFDNHQKILESRVAKNASYENLRQAPLGTGPRHLEPTATRRVFQDPRRKTPATPHKERADTISNAFDSLDHSPGVRGLGEDTSATPSGPEI